jgi:hypothetical protein
MKKIDKLSFKQMKRLLKKKNLPQSERDYINGKLNGNFEAWWKTLKQLDNPSTNKFYNLAVWQLYREGKAKKYNNGTQVFFVIDDKVSILDKMIEIRAQVGKFEANKAENIESIQELRIWKR